MQATTQHDTLPSPPPSGVVSRRLRYSDSLELSTHLECAGATTLLVFHWSRFAEEIEPKAPIALYEYDALSNRQGPKLVDLSVDQCAALLGASSNRFHQFPRAVLERLNAEWSEAELHCLEQEADALGDAAWLEAIQ